MRQLTTHPFCFTLQVPREGTEPGQSSSSMASQARPFPPLSAAMTSGSARNRIGKKKEGERRGEERGGRVREREREGGQRRAKR